MRPVMQVTAWTLIHFVWQGGLLALATAGALRLGRRHSSEARYAIACIGLTAMVAVPVITAGLLWTGGSALAAGGSIMPVLSVSEAAVTGPDSSADDVSSSGNGAAALTVIDLDGWLSLIVWGWLAGVTMLLVRFSGGCWRVHRVKVATLAEGESPWQPAAERLAARLGLTVAFRVVESGIVDTPGVIGWMRPVILLPVAVLTNLTPIQIEAILAHELAHIRRRDYAVNLLQTVAETLLFYHPGVWWVSARIREAREHCCDDVAVDVCGEPRAYAAALAELAAWRTGEPAHAVGAADGSLLARVRRLLRVPEDDEPRSITGVVVLALGILVAAAVAIQSSSAQAATTVAQPPAGDWRLHTTDHFEIYYPRDLDLHAERIGQEAERAYAHVSGDLRHSLAFKVPVVLFRTTSEFEQSVQAGRSGPPHAASFADPVRDRILLAMDHPADQWYGLITHEVTHIFLFDIVPGTATPRWISEGLAEYERGAWDPGDLAAVRDAVRSNAIPKMSGLQEDGGARDPRLLYSLGHAAFDFIESRWGAAGMRQFIFRLRQAASTGADPYEAALELKREEFDQAFERYLTERFAPAAGQAAAERFDQSATFRLEGDVIAVNSRVPAGLACIELLALPEGRVRRMWAVECSGGTAQDVMRVLKPGDRVIVTGAPARKQAAQRMVMQALVRPSDGFTWRAELVRSAGL